MSSSEFVDSQKICIKTEPVDSFEWEAAANPGQTAGAASGFDSNADDNQTCGTGSNEPGANGMTDNSLDLDNILRNKKIKRSDSDEDPCPQLGNSDLENVNEPRRDLKPTREELETCSREASKSNSAQSLLGADNSLGKTLATSLKLIATNDVNSPLHHSPARSDGTAYRIETLSCSPGSRVSGGTTPIMVMSPVFEADSKPAATARRYRTRSSSKKDDINLDKSQREDVGKIRTRDVDIMKPILNKDGSVTLYQCEECNKVFNKKQTLRQHFITHTDRFACPYCEARCKSKGDLRTHVQTHTKEKPYHCDVCNTDYTRESILKKHMKTQLHMRACFERDNLARLRKMTMNNDKDLDQFVPTQTKVKLEGFACTKCPKVCFSKVEYRKHCKTHALKHVCNVCQKGCQNALLLKIHQRSHNKPTTLTCKLCSRSFANFYCLKEHIMKLHKNRSPRKSSQENLIKAAISKHNKNITGKKSKASSSSKSARDGQSGAKGQRFKCETCSKAFTSEKRLNNHNRIHDGTYICGICKKTFCTMSKLKLHMKHHGQVWKCEICDAEFHAEVDLKEHSQNKHGEADFTCKICYGQFDNAIDLQHHMDDHAPTMLFSGASLDESTIPVVNRANKRPAYVGMDTSRYSDTEDSSDQEEPIACTPKRHEKIEARKSYDSDDDSIIESPDFNEIINSALDGSDDNLNNTELSDSDDELYSGIQAVLQDEVLSSADSNSDEESNEQFGLQKPLVYGHAEIIKAHDEEFDRNAEIDVTKKIFKCKLCNLDFEEERYLKNHLKIHVCEYCNKFFNHKEKLAAHKSQHIRQLLGQIKSEAKRLHIPRHKWKGYLMASSDSDNESEDRFLNELEDILEGEPQKAPRNVNFLHSLSHDEIVRANKPIFEQYSCLDLTNNIFACTICKRKYARPTTLTRHFKTHVCQFCNKFFEDKSDLLEHKYRHRKKAALMKAEITGEGSKMPNSPVVSKPNRDLFKRYSYVDSERNINRCTLCCKNFVRRTVLTRHMKTHICSHCDKFFEDKYDLAKHVSYHKVEKQYFDEDIGDHDDYVDYDEDEKQYSTNSSITGTLDHEEKSVTLPPSFPASLGHYNPPFHAQPSCSSRNETITFIQIPTTEAADSASTQVFSAPGNRESSFQIISQPVEVYKDTAPESFLVASTSCPGNESEKIITIAQPQIIPTSAEERERLFECGECGKRFFKNGHLKSHMTIHTGDRPYVCRLCGKAFGRGTTLRKHEKTHMKRCKICDTTFTHKYELDLHMEIHRTYAFYK